MDYMQILYIRDLSILGFWYLQWFVVVLLLEVAEIKKYTKLSRVVYTLFYSENNSRTHTS